MEYLAMYLRLSVEDEGDKDESNSISNQRKQIYEYIHHDSGLNQYRVVEFCDDGCSGTDMDRPGMQKMLKEIKANHIRCIVVKDMSRFSRDYIELGTYLNQIFPFMGVHFISINDHYDSRNHQGNTIELDTAFQTLLYDLYSKDISVKVKASLESRCENGEYVFGQVPFGYEKSREVKNAVVIKEEEAVIVRYIFSLALEGKSSTQIAKKLHEENIPAILQIRKPDKERSNGRIQAWSAASVRKILNNRFYLGEMAYGKSVRKSVGSKTGISVPVEDWKIIRSHHEALISEEVFEQVSSFRQGYSTRRKREKHPLTGKLYCGGCGYSLSYKPLRGRNKYRRFECGKHSLLQIPECCTYMNAETLEEIALLMLNKEISLRSNAAVQTRNLEAFRKAEISSLKKRQKEYRLQLKQAGAERDRLYEKYALRELTGERYQKKANELNGKISSLSVKAEETALQLAVLESEYRRAEEDINQMLRYLCMEELTQAAADMFIKKIHVYKDKRVEIEWSFISV